MYYYFFSFLKRTLLACRHLIRLWAIGVLTSAGTIRGVASTYRNTPSGDAARERRPELHKSPSESSSRSTSTISRVASVNETAGSAVTRVPTRGSQTELKEHCRGSRVAGTGQTQITRCKHRFPRPRHWPHKERPVGNQESRDRSQASLLWVVPRPSSLKESTSDIARVIEVGSLIDLFTFIWLDGWPRRVLQPVRFRVASAWHG
jgi:hypothetical protein